MSQNINWHTQNTSVFNKHTFKLKSVRTIKNLTQNIQNMTQELKKNFMLLFMDGFQLPHDYRDSYYEETVHF